MKVQDRLKYLRIATCAGLVAGIILSFELWFPVTRIFPRAPLFFELPESAVTFLERVFSILLIASLGLAALFQRRKWFAVAAVGFLVVLICFDQMRLQPWVWQYLILLILFGLSDRNSDRIAESDQTLGLAQIIVAGLYVWSGLQKLNYSFVYETLPALLEPFTGVLSVSQPYLMVLGLGVALTELLIGCALLYRETRKFAVWIAVAMHLVILTLLIAKDYNSVVWAWNGALIAMVIIAFWRSANAVDKSFLRTTELKQKAAASIVAASFFLPLLSFWELWDVYLSGALYSGRTEVGVIRLNNDLYERLPSKAKQTVFQTSGGERILPFFEWSMSELNVPVYPERRVFKEVACTVCKLQGDPNDAELIVKGRPAILDGTYTLIRIGCNDLD